MKKGLYILLALSIVVFNNNAYNSFSSFDNFHSFDDFDLEEEFETINNQIDRIRNQTIVAIEKSQRNFSKVNKEEIESSCQAITNIEIDYDEKDNKIIITLNIPNIDIDSVNIIPEGKILRGTISTKDGIIIKVKIEEDQLQLSTYKEKETQETSEERFSYFSSNNTTEMFQSLPCSIKPKDTSIEYEDGSLTIEVPTKIKSKKITVKRK